jgi:hypothetical protein
MECLIAGSQTEIEYDTFDPDIGTCSNSKNQEESDEEERFKVVRRYAFRRKDHRADLESFFNIINDWNRNLTH